MGLPLPFMVGLLVLVMSDQLDDRLPGSESLVSLALATLFMAVPWVVGRTTARGLRRAVTTGVAPGARLRLVLNVQWLSVPASYAVLVGFGQLPVFATHVSTLSVVQLLVLIGPLLVLEASMRVAEHPAIRWLELGALPQPAHLGPNRMRMSLFIAIPILLLGAGSDLLSLDRRLEVFLIETSLGSALVLIAMGLVLCVALPLVFRVIMPVSRQLPHGVAQDLRGTAEKLGFPGRAVLSMRTQHRMVNAALIGPFRWPRYLVLTDGLLALLDPEALRGVVAHEVGHGKANHPGLLVLIFACLPALLIQPAVLVDFSVFDSTVLVVLTAVLVVVAWLGLRLLFHRFEYEADQLSAEALGGALSCVRALRRVGELSPHGARRSSFRHPSEERRIRHMAACEADPAHRARFWRRGRWLRGSVVMASVVAVALFAWAQRELWPTDRALYLYHTGQVRDASQQLQRLAGDVPPSQQALVDELQREVDDTLELGLDAAPWDELREELAKRARPRFEAELADDPTAALPWVSLSLYQRDPPTWLRALYVYCRSVAAEDPQQAERVRRHLLELDPAPPPVVLTALQKPPRK